MYKCPQNIAVTVKNAYNWHCSRLACPAQLPWFVRILQPFNNLILVIKVFIFLKQSIVRSNKCNFNVNRKTQKTKFAGILVDLAKIYESRYHGNGSVN